MGLAIVPWGVASGLNGIGDAFRSPSLLLLRLLDQGFTSQGGGLMLA